MRFTIVITLFCVFCMTAAGWSAPADRYAADLSAACCSDRPCAFEQCANAHCAAFVPQCWLEGIDVYVAVQKMVIGLLLNSEQELLCFRVATAGDMLDIVETALAYRICALRFADEEPDEETLARLLTVKKSFLAVAELLYIAELLTCR